MINGKAGTVAALRVEKDTKITVKGNSPHPGKGKPRCAAHEFAQAPKLSAGVASPGVSATAGGTGVEVGVALRSTSAQLSRT